MSYFIDDYKTGIRKAIGMIENFFSSNQRGAGRVTCLSLLTIGEDLFTIIRGTCSLVDVVKEYIA